MARSAPTVLMLLTITATSAVAAEQEGLTPGTRATETNVTALIPVGLETSRRPAALPALYVSLAVLQLVDAKVTLSAVQHGARELNPIMRRGNQATVWAVKAASTVGTIYFVERIWKKNRVAAVVVMAGINGGYAAIAAHNIKQAR